MQTSPNPIALGLYEPGNKTIKLQVFEIGAWDMDATTVLNIAHSLDIQKIVGINAVIRKDDYSELYPLKAHITFPFGEGHIEVTAGFITLKRRLGGYWDNVNYNDVVMNRGFVMVWYID